jgi:tubulin polyglutamylase TTLL6/13
LYVKNPLTISGYKFDLRVYVLIISVDPLRILIFKEGIITFCSTPYETPNPYNPSAYLDSMHFPRTLSHTVSPTSSSTSSASTATASDLPQQDKDKPLSWLWQWMESNGGDSDETWSEIKDIVVKTVISAAPSIAHATKSCKADREPSLLDNNPFTCFEVLNYLLLFDYFLLVKIILFSCFLFRFC